MSDIRATGVTRDARRTPHEEEQAAPRSALDLRDHEVSPEARRAANAHRTPSNVPSTWELIAELEGLAPQLAPRFP